MNRRNYDSRREGDKLRPLRNSRVGGFRSNNEFRRDGGSNPLRSGLRTPRTDGRTSRGTRGHFGRFRSNRPGLGSRRFGDRRNTGRFRGRGGLRNRRGVGNGVRFRGNSQGLRFRRNRPSNQNSNPNMQRQFKRGLRRLGQRPNTKKNEGCLYLYNINKSVTNLEIKQVFEVYGKLRRCAVFYDKNTKEHLGWGVVQFSTRINAHRALSDLNGKILYLFFKVLI